MSKTHMKKFAVHQFQNRENLPFSPVHYSMLKHGSGTIAQAYGNELAIAFFNNYSHLIVNEQVVVLESAYSYVKNAASVITEHFTNKLNSLLSEFNGKNVQRLKINRIVPYITDYGKLSVAKRKKLLKQDTFTFDYNFAEGKFLVFIDDIFITGTHHKKIEEMLGDYGIDMEKTMSLYYAELVDPKEDPSIESYLNNAQVLTLKDLSNLIHSESNYRVIVRTLKMILGEPDEEKLKEFLDSLQDEMISDFYLQCLGEGYHKNPVYSSNFSILRAKHLKLK